MRTTMWRQPADLRGLLADAAAAERVADRLRAERVFIVGTGTSWHAANIAAWYLREAGLVTIPVQAADAALHGPRPEAGDALQTILLQPYLSGAGGAKNNPTAYVWFDELIISARPIAAPTL